MYVHTHIYMRIHEETAYRSSHRIRGTWPSRTLSASYIHIYSDYAYMYTYTHISVSISIYLSINLYMYTDPLIESVEHGRLRRCQRHRVEPVDLICEAPKVLRV